MQCACANAFDICNSQQQPTWQNPLTGSVAIVGSITYSQLSGERNNYHNAQREKTASNIVGNRYF